MPTCETCGNQYDKCFDVIIGGRPHTFDSFECAIQHALIVRAGLSATALRLERRRSVAPTVLGPVAHPMSATGLPEPVISMPGKHL